MLNILLIKAISIPLQTYFCLLLFCLQKNGFVLLWSKHAFDWLIARPFFGKYSYFQTTFFFFFVPIVFWYIWLIIVRCRDWSIHKFFVLKLSYWSKQNIKDTCDQKYFFFYNKRIGERALEALGEAAIFYDYVSN